MANASISRKARVGFFVFIGLAVLIGGLFLIGQNSKLFSRSYHVNAFFNNVGGLTETATVNVAGVRVGTVEKIILPNTAQDKVTVVLRLDEDTKRLVRKDSEARIETAGLVGDKIVEITPGSTGAAVVEDGGTVPTREPFQISVVIDRFNLSAQRVDSLIIGIGDIVQHVKSGEGTVGKLFYDNTIHDRIASMVASADQTFQAVTAQADDIARILADVSVNINDITGRINSGQGTIGALIGRNEIYENLRQMSETMNQSSTTLSQGIDSFNENMEALKHNFFFKSYYEERGYWDRAVFEQQLDEQRKSLLRLKRDLEEKQRELDVLQRRLGQPSSSLTPPTNAPAAQLSLGRTDSVATQPQLVPASDTSASARP